MALTVIASILHQIAMGTSMPTLVDDLTNSFAFRRRQTRPLQQWEIVVPGTQEKLEDLRGLIAYAQGDTPIWYDAADMLEVTEPKIFGIGDGMITDFRLPDKNVFVASLIIYQNGAATNTWQPLGGDGITCDVIRFTSPPGQYAQLRCKFRRKAKVVIRTDADIGQQRFFRNKDSHGQTIAALTLTLMEVPA